MSDPNGPPGLSPLERYLLKQKQTQGRAADEAVGPSRADELAVPAYPPQPAAQTSPDSVVADVDAVKSAEFGSRLGAYLIDIVIIGALKWPLSTIVFGALSLFLGRYVSLVEDSFEFIITYAVMFAYYGWFYSEKGATPGKMLLGLQVIDSSTKGRLTYGKAFFREAVGKFISLIPLFAGFLLALFREDRKALHDLIFDTKVVSSKKP